MIDLHLHSYYSDGILSPKELVLRAKKKGINIISITDHDGVRGLREGKEAGLRYGVDVIKGIELSTEDDDKIYMHILGFCFDDENDALKTEILKVRQMRTERNEKILAVLQEMGYKLTKEDLQLREGQDYVGKPTFAFALMKKGYVSSPRAAFKEGCFMRSDAVKRVHREKIVAKKAIELIKGAGGIPVLAHPMKINFRAKKEGEGFFEKLEQQIIKLKKWGLEGMECYYSGHTLQETKLLVQLANKHALKATAGSDFHGFGTDRCMGCFHVDENFDENKIIKEIKGER